MKKFIPKLKDWLSQVLYVTNTRPTRNLNSLVTIIWTDLYNKRLTDQLIYDYFKNIHF